MPKRSIRQKLLRQRQLLEDSVCLQRSKVVQQRLLKTDQYRQASVIALYAPIHNEVQTAEIFNSAVGDGKRVCLPRVKGHSIELVEVEALDSLKTGAFGIAEPVGETILPASAIDLIVVPGVGFDRIGFRLGYGQGYYDRAFSGDCPKVLAGLAYDFQIVNELPAEDHDIRLDLLVMETALLAF